MQTKKGLLTGIAAGLLFTCSVSHANARQIHFKGEFAGTFLGTRIDLNDDGIAASWATAVANGTLGKHTSQAVVEVVPAGPTSECPGGVFIIDAQNGIGFGINTGTFPNGDQVYTRILTRSQCRLDGGRFTGSDTVSFVGGTGKFAGASGTFEQHFTGFFEAFDPNANPAQAFGSFSGGSEGALILP